MTQKTERPGGAATPSEPLTHNLPKEMSDMTHSTPNVASIAPNGPHSISMDLEALATMPLDELRSLYSALNTLGDVLAGLYCKPRYWQREQDTALSPAGLQLDAILDFLSSYQQACINVATARKPETERDVEERARLLIEFDVGCDDTLNCIAALAANAAYEAEEMLRKARRAAA
ncbi:hypothetical protein AB2N04_14625 [Nitratireductor sp. GISD-1A_MAKvit]|uniref:hypothetical protein n=1 Tax=Nitratireductor sp. GISD-1A_MAKvit TaxID=3234198 RepID=UPI0034679C16